jgi:acetyl/propionyl-CoA carboxylase alpha subunit
MWSQLSTHGPTREAALESMEHALDSYVVRGLTHNIPFLRSVVSDPVRLSALEIVSSLCDFASSCSPRFKKRVSSSVQKKEISVRSNRCAGQSYQDLRSSLGEGVYGWQGDPVVIFSWKGGTTFGVVRSSRNGANM